MGVVPIIVGSLCTLAAVALATRAIGSWQAYSLDYYFTSPNKKKKEFSSSPITSPNSFDYYFLLRVPRRAPTFHPRLALTTALIVGLRIDEIKGLWGRLSFMKDYIHAPMVLPTLLVETKSIWLYERLDLCHEGISKTKRLTRMDVRSLVDPAVGETGWLDC